RRPAGVEGCKDRSGAIQESGLANSFRTGGPTGCRKRRRRSVRMRRRAQPRADVLWFVPKADARKSADGLPPIIRAWSLSNAPSLQWTPVTAGIHVDPKNSDKNT